MDGVDHISLLLWALGIGLPFLSFVVAALLKDRYGWIASLTGPLLLLVACICSAILAFHQWGEAERVFSLPWFSVASTPVDLAFFFSTTSLAMSFVVSLIAFLVHLYSAGYMAGDAGPRRYFAMLGLFTFAMQGLVFSDNVIQLFFFWELVSFCSYTLIGHYQESTETGRASTKAFLVNRVADLGFLAGMAMLYASTGTVNITSIAEPIPSPWHTTASLCFFLAAMGKSAQFPFFIWLPDAMKGPTPVSALIHAATMVAAGVYLLIRLSPLLSPASLEIIAVVGACTALLAALAALAQTDLKRILAFSTISQLGLMMLAIGCGSPGAAFIHLVAHAFFKACLFLGAGSVIHSLEHAAQRSHVKVDIQDIRTMGGLSRAMPVTFATFIIATSALAGIPMTSGFLSKESVLFAVLDVHYASAVKAFLLASYAGVSFLTIAYGYRMVRAVFLGDAKIDFLQHVLEAPVIMRIPAIVLATASLWIGISWSPLALSGWSSDFVSQHGGLWANVLSTVWIGFALIVSIVWLRKRDVPAPKVLVNAFYLDRVITTAVTKLSSISASAFDNMDRKMIDGAIHRATYLYVAGAHAAGWFDRTIVDGLLQALAGLVRMTGSFFRSFQSGKVQLYVFWSLFAIIIFLIWTLN